MKDGGSAFPQLVRREERYMDEGGMTLRDYFAAAALQGWAAGRNAECVKSGGSHPDVIARSCYAYADAMLAAREVPNG